MNYNYDPMLPFRGIGLTFVGALMVFPAGAYRRKA